MLNCHTRFDNDPPTRALFHGINVSFSSKPPNQDKCIDLDDSVFVGEALDRYWLTMFSEGEALNTEGLRKDINTRLEEVLQRSAKGEFSDAMSRSGWILKSDPASPAIDPSGDINSSNWLSKRNVELSRVTDPIALRRLQQGVENNIVP